MSTIEQPGVRLLRELAREGSLATSARTAPPGLRSTLSAAAYHLAWPLVFSRVTRPVERRRGHWRCSTGLARLAPDCVDGFHDDVESVVADLLGNAKARILDVEAWMAGRLTAATVDGHRRRRGQRGALQRPRMSDWLAAELGHDPWLIRLALHVLDWAGVPESAGHGLWPLDAWALRRAEAKGDPGAACPRAVRADLDRVLTAMRRRPAWFADYVERPFGAKTPPVAPPPGDGAHDSRPLVPVTAQESDDLLLTGLAAEAVEAIGQAVRRGDDPRACVVRVVEAVFGAPPGLQLDRAPGTAPDWAATVSERLADPDAVDRIVAEILAAL